jgi:hypothetical protein
MYYRKQLTSFYKLKLNSHFMMVKAEGSQPRGRGFKSFTFKTIIIAQFIWDQSAILKLCTTLTWHCCIFCKPVHCTLRMVSIWNPDDTECTASLSADTDQRTISKRTELTSSQSLLFSYSISECANRAKKSKQTFFSDVNLDLTFVL